MLDRSLSKIKNNKPPTSTSHTKIGIITLSTRKLTFNNFKPYKIEFSGLLFGIFFMKKWIHCGVVGGMISWRICWSIGGS